MKQIPVQYIFRRARWVDTIYGTGLVFVTSQTRLLPEDIALKFLRHKDTFKIDTEFVDASAPKTEQQQTDETLAEIEAQRKQAEEVEAERFELFDRIDQMATKDALAQFAADKFAVTLNKRDSIPDLRVEVKALIDRFGATP